MRVIDSLKLALKNAKLDTSRCTILSALSETASEDEWPNFNEALQKLAESKLKTISLSDPEYKFYRKKFADALNNTGYLEQLHGNIPKALDYYGKSLKIREEVLDKNGIATSLINIGFIYQSQGDIAKALDYYGRGLKIQEEIDDKKGIAYSLINIGAIYNNQGDISKALDYYGKSLKIFEKIGDKKGIAFSLINFGVIYNYQGNLPKALEYYGKSLKIREEIGDKQGMAFSLNNIGVIYDSQGDPSITSSKEDAIKAGIPKALEYYGRSLKIGEEIGDKEGIALSLNNIGGIYMKQKNYSMALVFSNRSMKVSRELGYIENIRSAAERLNQIYKATGNYKLALENYELFIQMRDSINNEATRKASIKNQLKYEYEKQAAADSVAHAKETDIKNAELAKQKAEISAKKNQQYALFGGLALVMVFAGFMYNRFKVTQKQKVIIEHQKEIVEEQKHLVEEKQKEILDSIQYARRIQMAQIPSEKQVAKSLARLKKL